MRLYWERAESSAESRGAPVPSSGISALVRAVGAYFEDNGVAAQVLFGMTKRGEWAKSRVVFIPGHYDGSEAPRPMAGGVFDAPQQKESLNPRELTAWIRAITVSIFAVDPTNVTDEEAQNTALENLLESTQQAMWNAIDPISQKNVGGPGIKFLDSLVVQPPVQMAYGREILMWCTMQTPLFDLPEQVRTPTPALTKKIVTTLYEPVNP